MDILYINGLNAKKTWGLVPLCDKFYSSIMKYPDIKERVMSDFEDEDGIRVATSDGKLKSQEATLSFIVDTLENYYSFCDYITSHQNFELSTFEVGKVIMYEYIAHTDFNWRRTYITFGVKLREANFKERKNFNLVTENNDYICTETGNRLII